MRHLFILALAIALGSAHGPSMDASGPEIGSYMESNGLQMAYGPCMEPGGLRLAHGPFMEPGGLRLA